MMYQIFHIYRLILLSCITQFIMIKQWIIIANLILIFWTLISLLPLNGFRMFIKKQLSIIKVFDLLEPIRIHELINDDITLELNHRFCFNRSNIFFKCSKLKLE